MTLPAIGTAVSYYWESGQSPVPAQVQSVDDIGARIMVTYISPASYTLGFPGAPVLTSPWASQGSGTGQWEPLS